MPSLHDRAMNLAEEAVILKFQRRPKESIEKFVEAFELELRAASTYRDDHAFEPTRSVLYRSAASLALHGELFREAEQCIGQLLAGNPPADIADEARNIYEKINFERHLKLKGGVMPSRTKRPCRYPMCPNLVESGYCEKHANHAVIVRKPDDRPDRRKRGYDAEWYKIRNRFLKEHPICMERGCSMPATDVDHNVPLRKGGTHAKANLRAYCHSHHSRKTASRDGGFGNYSRKEQGK